MHWTTIGRSSTAAQTPPKVEWTERAPSPGTDRCSADRTLDFAHVRGLSARPGPSSSGATSGHSAKNWARLLADLKRHFQR